MKRLGWFAAAAALMIWAIGFGAPTPPAAADDAAQGPKVTTFTLENGLEAVVIQDHRAPVVTHMVWYRVGAVDEPLGASGVAHFLEHLMFKGTHSVPSGRFSEIVAENGGQDNAFTSLDYTAYFQRIAADRLGLVMELEADRMANLVLSEQDVRTERDVVIEERNQRTDNDPQSLFFEQFNAALYLAHPYGVPVIGWRAEIEALDRDDALSFYETHYGPENAILVVAGDVYPDEVRALAEQHYGAVPRGGVAERPLFHEPPQLAARRIEMTHDQVRQPFLVRSYLAPSYVTAEPGRGEALSIASDILGGGVTSRLTQALVLDQKIAINAGASYRGLSRDATSFSVYAVPADGVTLLELEAAVDAVIAEFVAEGPTDEELARAQNILISSAIYQQDSQSGMARMYGAALAIGLTVDDVQAWSDRIRAVSATDVRDALGSLRIEASVTGYLEHPDDVARRSPAIAAE